MAREVTPDQEEGPRRRPRTKKKKKSAYGNLNKLESFNDAWNGEFHQKLRRGFHGQDELATACTTCTCIDRYQGMTELLSYLRSLGISYEDLPKQDAFNPPEGKLQL